MSKSKAASVSQDSEVHVTYEDQQKINVFARVNSKMLELEGELDGKKKSLQDIADASDEIMMLEDEIMVPFSVGGVFVECSQDDAQEKLDQAKEELDADVSGLGDKISGHKDTLQQLKVQLYAKFGNNINLEADK